MREFKFYDVEQENIRQWIAEHEAAHKVLDDLKVLGEFNLSSLPMDINVIPQYSYEFAPGPIGTSVKVRCTCGAQKDVTDVDSW